MSGYLYILGCILFTVYGQLVIKWRMSLKGSLPDGLRSKLSFLLSSLIYDAFILSAFAAAFAASLCWLAAVTKFELSFAYPFMALSFVLVFILSAIFLGETVTPGKIIGVLLIITGIVAIARL